MARNFLQFPSAPYNGTYSSKSFNNGSGQQKGLMVPLTIVWGSYLFNGLPLGSSNPNFAIAFNLNSAGPNTVSGTWTVQSVYIDNEAVNFPVYVYFTDTGFSISCPANSAGWYAVYTSQRSGLVIGLGVDNNTIVNDEFTNVFFTDVFMVPSLDQEEPFAADFNLISPFITFSGSGGQLDAVSIIASGSGYTSGALAVSGGGGTGATAGGTVDQFGRFTGASVGSPGGGYVGNPSITPTAAQNKIAPWSSSTLFSVGEFTSFGGTYWEFIGPDNETAPGGPAPPGNGAFMFSNTGIAANQPAAFASGVTAITPGTTIETDNTFGARAAGDQTITINTTVEGGGVFGTPFPARASGFIYITHIYAHQVASVAGGSILKLLNDDAVSTVFTWETPSDTGGITFYELQNAQIKLPATSNWFLDCTSFAGNVTVTFTFVFTFAEI
jgi:hypothetical protein